MVENSRFQEPIVIDEVLNGFWPNHLNHGAQNRLLVSSPSCLSYLLWLREAVSALNWTSSFEFAFQTQEPDKAWIFWLKKSLFMGSYWACELGHDRPQSVQGLCHCYADLHCHGLQIIGFTIWKLGIYLFKSCKVVYLKRNMAAVSHYFLLVLVFLDSHAAQPPCLPGCTCSEESFGRWTVLAKC